MSLVLPNSVFLHVPKTGGSWVAAVLRRAGLAHGRDLRRRTAESFSGLRRPVFAFVRNPLSWYQSRWADRHARLHWRGKLRSSPLNFRSEAELTDFNLWMRGVLRRNPGWVGNLYRSRLGNLGRVGRTENLRGDLAGFLDEFEPGFDRGLLSLPPVNEGVALDREYEPDVLERAIKSERETLLRLGYPLSFPGGRGNIGRK